MQPESLRDKRDRAAEWTAGLRSTRFSHTAPQFESIIGFLDKVNPAHRIVEKFMRTQYEFIIRHSGQLMETDRMLADLNVLPAPPLTRPCGERIIKSMLVETLVSEEAREYAVRHGHGKTFIPHGILESAANSWKIIEGKTVDIGLSIEPEGCAYAYFFDAQGMKVLHVFADFDGNGGIDYRKIDELGNLEGKRVLLIEDDVQSGITLRTVLRQIAGAGAASYSLFLGNRSLYQNLGSVPRTVSKVYLNGSESSCSGRDEMEQNLIDHFGPLVFEKYSVFR